MSTSLSGHAYLISGTSETISAVAALLKKDGVEISGNPDAYVRAYAQFGVEEARELRERANARAIGSARRIFIVAAPGMTNEAQNALLKTLEEPPGNAQFFLIVPSPDTLLSTVRSRVERLSPAPVKVNTEDAVDAKKFLAATPEKRLDMLKPLLEKDDDDKRDMSAIVAFLSGLERALSKEPEGLRAVYRARKFAMDKGALLKPLLEQVALLVPRM